ncbi:hypothetical protein CEXT_317041 [Caerostris extrusa]|uniref:Uncharacterized protein n=1 Tax=Caerostris extrusa TaxID=172846 RepID=A0AAV4NPQ6_CAEEX|nr:hypothetical protein CEXT_317041 [Caerostris extrusa]
MVKSKGYSGGLWRVFTVRRANAVQFPPKAMFSFIHWWVIPKGIEERIEGIEKSFLVWTFERKEEYKITINSKYFALRDENMETPTRLRMLDTNHDVHRVSEKSVT